MAILEETYNYEQNIAKIFSDHNVREILISKKPLRLKIKIDFYSEVHR